MAKQLLRAKSDYKELEKNWVSGFFGRHLTLQAKYSRILDQDRFLAQNRDIIQDWFNLYRSIKAEYGIFDEDTYNMDKNGYMMGITESSKVVFSKYQKQAFMNQARNRKWASFIEAISTNDRQLPLFVILNCKKWKYNWFIPELEPGDRISLSKKGWTDTRSYLWGQYWLFIVDGYASYVSTKFIKFTRAHKIICLCLSSKSTYLLQSLDVSVFDPLKQNYKKLLAEKNLVFLLTMLIKVILFCWFKRLDSMVLYLKIYNQLGWLQGLYHIIQLWYSKNFCYMKMIHRLLIRTILELV